MIIAEDGSYYIMSCEKCGAEIRKHKSYCTRYGEVYHFNPELKCEHCGFSAKVVYGKSPASFSPEMSNSGKNEAKAPCLKCNPIPIAAGKQEAPDGNVMARVVLRRGVTGESMNEKEINLEEEGENCPEFIKKRIDVKVETVIETSKVLNELTQKKAIHENTKIMIITNFGVVEGTLKLYVDPDDAAQRISLASAKIRNNYLSQLEKEIDNPIITNNYFFVTVLDARVIPFANPRNMVNFAVLNLFSDQIVGFTFGEYRQENLPD